MPYKPTQPATRRQLMVEDIAGIIMRNRPDLREGEPAQQLLDRIDLWLDCLDTPILRPEPATTQGGRGGRGK